MAAVEIRPGLVHRFIKEKWRPLAQVFLHKRALRLEQRAGCVGLSRFPGGGFLLRQLWMKSSSMP
jgi:hypothetical protein